MPFKSKAQMKKFFAMEAKGELPKGTAKRWLKETRTPISKLPKKKKKSKRASVLTEVENILALREAIHIKKAKALANASAGVLLAYFISSINSRIAEKRAAASRKIHEEDYKGSLKRAGIFSWLGRLLRKVPTVDKEVARVVAEDALIHTSRGVGALDRGTANSLADDLTHIAKNHGIIPGNVTAELEQQLRGQARVLVENIRGNALNDIKKQLVETLRPTVTDQDAFNRFLKELEYCDDINAIRNAATRNNLNQSIIDDVLHTGNVQRIWREHALSAIENPAKTMQTILSDAQRAKKTMQTILSDAQRANTQLSKYIPSSPARGRPPIEATVTTKRSWPGAITLFTAGATAGHFGPKMLGSTGETRSNQGGQSNAQQGDTASSSQGAQSSSESIRPELSDGDKEMLKRYLTNALAYGGAGALLGSLGGKLTGIDPRTTALLGTAIGGALGSGLTSGKYAILPDVSSYL